MLTLNDGRDELWQWDTGRTLAVDADCSQVHFSNKVFGRSIDVDVIDGVAIIPDVMLQTDKDLNVWAFVGTAENGYTKISKIFTVNRRNKPADYVFTPTDQMTLQMIKRQIGDLADLTTEAKDTLVAAINEAAKSGGGGGGVELDTTLTQSGKAADAKATGDELRSLSSKIDNLPSGGSGLTASEKTAILTLFKAAAYTSDVSATITQLVTLWGGESGGGDSGGGETGNAYTVTNNLTNVTNSNAATSVEAGGYYSATLSAETGYNISVNITMGGVDITDSVYTEDGTILITEVTGDIVITATAELATAPVLYQLSNTPRIVNADLHEDTGLTFGSDSANGYAEAWTICVDAVVSTRSKVLFGVNDSEANAKCLQFQTNGAGNGIIYINNNPSVQSPVNSEERHRFVITHSANADKAATVHIVTDGAVVSTVVSASYGSFIYSGYAGNLNIGGKSSADFVGTINEFVIYEGILSDAHISEFLGVA